MIFSEMHIFVHSESTTSCLKHGLPANTKFSKCSARRVNPEGGDECSLLQNYSVVGSTTISSPEWMLSRMVRSRSDGSCLLVLFTCAELGFWQLCITTGWKACEQSVTELNMFQKEFELMD